MKYAKHDYIFKECIYRAAFLLYDLEKEQIVVLATSENSRELKIEERIDFKLGNADCLPRDVYTCNMLSYKE